MATQELYAPRLGEVGETCRTCGAPLATDQRYCLNCGERRTGPRLDFGEIFGPPPGAQAPAPAAAAEPPRSSWWTPRNGAIAAGGVAGLLLLGGLIGFAVKDPEIQVASPEPVVVNAGAAAAPAAAPTAATAEFVSDWTGEDGWTIQLQTLPKDGTDPAAVAQAKADATAKGATAVGALDSDEYPSLDPGAYVIYSGVYASKKEATAALKDLEAAFPDATVVEVSTTSDTEADAAQEDDAAADTGAADTASEEDLAALEDASGEKYVEQSKKLKDETATEGAPPKPDNKAPGAGDEGDVIE